MVRPRQEFLNVSYLCIYLSIYVSIYLSIQLSAIPQGPSSKAKGKKKKPRRRCSEKTKAMLKPPQSSQVTPSNPSSANQPVVWNAASFLPGLPSEASTPAVLSCVAAKDSDNGAACMAATKSGTRCLRKRVTGNYCQQHYRELAYDGVKHLFEDMQDMFDAARRSWDQQQIDLALKLSFQESSEQAARRAASLRLVDRRLKKESLKRIPVTADGDCLFTAVAWSAGIAMDPFALRQEVVSYLKTFPEMFCEWFDLRWSSYDQYLTALSRKGCWGDDLCCMALSHLLLRPAARLQCVQWMKNVLFHALQKQAERITLKCE